MIKRSIYETLQRWRDNPENPKNVQIPYYLIIGMQMFLKMIDTSTLSNDDKAAYELIAGELAGKRGKVRRRQAYKEVVRAPKGEKQAALDDYHATKDWTFLDS